jgi:hypothetical protein
MPNANGGEEIKEGGRNKKDMAKGKGLERRNSQPVIQSVLCSGWLTIVPRVTF